MALTPEKPVNKTVIKLREDGSPNPNFAALISGDTEEEIMARAKAMFSWARFSLHNPEDFRHKNDDAE